MKQLISLILTFCICYVLPNSISICANKEKQQESFVKIDNAQTFEGAELRIIEGIPFLKLSGSYYEMGNSMGF